MPVDSFDTARKALSRLGKLTSSSESEKDVTTQVIDTAERVQTLQNSLDRLQRFQRSAKDVDDLIQFEDQITSRQAELQSLKAQQSYLSSQTSMSTITLTLSQPGKEPPGALDDAGFLAGCGRAGRRWRRCSWSPDRRRRRTPVLGGAGAGRRAGVLPRPGAPGSSRSHFCIRHALRRVKV